MNEIIAEHRVLLTIIGYLIGLFGMCAVLLILHRKDSYMMSEVKSGVSRMNDRLHDQTDHKQEVLSGEHKEIWNGVKTIQLKQEQELSLQEKIKDTVPDAGMLKDGIEKICQENLQMKDEIIELRHEMQQLKGEIREMSQELRRDRERSRGMER